MKEDKKIYNNRNSLPRMGRGDFSKMLITKELFTKFKKSFPEYKDMKWGEFYSKWLDIAETIRKETITNPLGVKLGSYTGELKLQYLPYKLKAIDSHTSAELGKSTQYANIMTRGKVAVIKWERRKAGRFNKMLQFYGFSPIQEMEVMAKDYILANPEKLRVSRVTLGGRNLWTLQKKKQNGN